MADAKAVFDQAKSKGAKGDEKDFDQIEDNKALSIKPDYAEAWNNIFFPLQAIKFQKRSNQNLDALYPKDINSNYGSIKLSILNYKLHRGQKSEGFILIRHYKTSLKLKI